MCGPVCVCVGVHKSWSVALSSEQSIYSPPEGMAGREGDGNCAVESKRGDELSLVN